MHSTECIYHVVPDPCMCWASRENANNNVVHFKLTALWHELLIKASHYSLAQTSHYTPDSICALSYELRSEHPGFNLSQKG